MSDNKWLEIKFEGGTATLSEAHRQMSFLTLLWKESDLIILLIAISDHLKDLRRVNLTHGNIKPQNIVFLPITKNKFEIRLINYESSQILRESKNTIHDV